MTAGTQEFRAPAKPGMAGIATQIVNPIHPAAKTARAIRATRGLRSLRYENEYAESTAAVSGGSTLNRHGNWMNRR
jgi:hypothetical protein